MSAPPGRQAEGRDRTGAAAGNEDTDGTTPDEVLSLISTLVMHSPRFEWRLRYQRDGWRAASTKIFQSKAAAQKYAAKLRLERTDLAPLVLLIVDRRAVGAWAAFASLVDDGEGVAS